MRPFKLPSNPSRADSSAYVYLCEHADVWRTWCAVVLAYPTASDQLVAAMVRHRGVAVPSEHVRSISRIYRASVDARAEVAA